MAAVGLSTLGFLGICLVQAIVPINYNGKLLVYVFYILVMGIMEQMVGFHLLCEVNVLVSRTVPHHSPHLLLLALLKVSTAM